MIYGLYLSATGVLTNSYRQDVIANNLANAETVGFKRDLALFRERPTEAREEGLPSNHTDPILEMLGGGVLALPTAVDTRQGELEPTGNEMDVAIQGPGYFRVEEHGETRLTRDGRFMVDRNGNLILANGSGHRVLDAEGQPIQLGVGKITIGDDGWITQNDQPVAQIGVVEPPDPSLLRKRGGTLLSYPNPAELRPVGLTSLRTGFIERANVDPATELTMLMDAQRQLEANANMIRYHDQTLAKLVNEVGKIA